jgi:hypothetical protein
MSAGRHRQCIRHAHYSMSAFLLVPAPKRPFRRTKAGMLVALCGGNSDGRHMFALSAGPASHEHLGVHHGLREAACAWASHTRYAALMLVHRNRWRRHVIAHNLRPVPMFAALQLARIVLNGAIYVIQRGPHSLFVCAPAAFYVRSSIALTPPRRCAMHIQAWRGR